MRDVLMRDNDPSLPLAFNISRLFEQPIEAIFHPKRNRQTFLNALSAPGR
jgi:DNA-binding XRE family transcriptional regulator